MKKVFQRIPAFLLLAFVAFSVTSTASWVGTIATVLFWVYAIIIPPIAICLAWAAFAKLPLLKDHLDKLGFIKYEAIVFPVLQVAVFLYAGWAWSLFWATLALVIFLYVLLSKR